MNINQMKKQLEIMKEMLADMRQERIEAGAKYSDSSDFIQQLDSDISIATLTIRNCQRLINQQNKENK